MRDRPNGGVEAEPSRRRAMIAVGAGTAALLTPALIGWSQPGSSQPTPDDDDYLAGVITGATPLIRKRAAAYRVTKPLSLATGITVTLEPGVRLAWAGPAPQAGEPIGVFDVMGDDVAIRVIDGGTAFVECEAPSPSVYAVVIRGRRGVTVVGLEGRDCQHVHVHGAIDYSSARTAGLGANLARDIRIEGGGARFRVLPAGNGNGACMLSYVANVHVTGARYENVTSGVQWWGGDAGLEPWQNGARANERKCSDIVIERVVVRGARIGGIWGSMGRRITVRDCSVENCLDVGYDAEGCDDVTFERCVAHNGHNGCFATFALCSGIRFVRCRGSVDKKAYPLMRVYNATQSHADNHDIVVVGGTFECLDPTGPSTIDTAMGPSRELTIADATLKNVRIDTAHFNMHRTVITGNVLTFTAPLGKSAAIRAGASKGSPADPGSVSISGNRIRYTGTEGLPVAIQIEEDDVNSNARDLVSTNIVSGAFATAVVFVNATISNAVVPAVDVVGNRFEGLRPRARLIEVRRVGASPAPMVRWDHTQTRDGQPVPLARALIES